MRKSLWVPLVDLDNGVAVGLLDLVLVEICRPADLMIPEGLLQVDQGKELYFSLFDK